MIGIALLCLNAYNRSAFLVTLEDIHRAGVLHGDLRPQNLLVDGHGKATIIDFDQSEREASKRDMEREIADLVHILDTL